MKWILSLLLCLSASAQIPVFPFNPTSASPFLPTAPTNTLVLWAELTPTNGTYGGSTGATVPANDGQVVKFWTNLCGFIPGSKWNSDQAVLPVYNASGGGGGGTSPRVSFTGADFPRMVGPTIPDLTNLFTVVMVANCTGVAETDLVISDGLTGNSWLDYNSSKLEMSQGTTISSAATIGTGYYVITLVFAAGASSHIDTNGVLMVSGNAGSANLRSPYLCNGAKHNVNISRIWGWYGILNSTDISKAVAQCRTDFGI